MMEETYERNAAFYANADYTFDRRYSISASARYDGSNQLGRGAAKRWLPTWTFAGKWIISNEAFMENASRIVDFMSLRASYGLTANIPPSASNAMALYLQPRALPARKRRGGHHAGRLAEHRADVGEELPAQRGLRPDAVRRTARLQRGLLQPAGFRPDIADQGGGYRRLHVEERELRRSRLAGRGHHARRQDDKHQGLDLVGAFHLRLFEEHHPQRQEQSGRCSSLSARREATRTTTR